MFIRNLFALLQQEPASNGRIWFNGHGEQEQTISLKLLPSMLAKNMQKAQKSCWPYQQVCKRNQIERAVMRLTAHSSFRKELREHMPLFLRLG